MSDSFADLWNTSAPLPAKPKPQTLTLAARLAEENDKRHRATTVNLQSHKAPDVSHAAWAGLDSLDSGVKTKVDNDDDWGLRDFGSAAVNSNSNPKSTSTSTSKTLWDLRDFASSTGPTPSRSTPSYLKPQSRPISRPTSRLSNHSSSQVHQQNVNSPDMDFDFGSREDQDDDRDILATDSQALKSSAHLHLLDDDDDEHGNLMGGIDNHDDEEDILGMLSKPVEVVIAKKVFLFLFTAFFLSFLFSDEMDLKFLLSLSSELGFENLDGPLTFYTAIWTRFKTSLSTPPYLRPNC